MGLMVAMSVSASPQTHVSSLHTLAQSGNDSAATASKGWRAVAPAAHTPVFFTRVSSGTPRAPQPRQHGLGSRTRHSNTTRSDWRPGQSQSIPISPASRNYQSQGNEANVEHVEIHLISCAVAPIVERSRPDSVHQYTREYYTPSLDFSCGWPSWTFTLAQERHSDSR